jgi:hypothetical protein
MDREYIQPQPGSWKAVENAKQLQEFMDAPKTTASPWPTEADYKHLAKVTNVSKAEYTGGSVSYYSVLIKSPTNKNLTPYTAECNDIIEALGMNYAEGNAFKAIWRSCAARNLGVGKKGYTDGKYDAEKVVFFGQRMVEQFAGK